MLGRRKKQLRTNKMKNEKIKLVAKSSQEFSAAVLIACTVLTPILLIIAILTDK